MTLIGPSPSPLPRTANGGESRATLLQCSLRSHEYSGCHIPNIASPPWRTRPETVASRRDCHRGRGGRATQGSGTQLDNRDALPPTAPALDCKNAGVFQSSTRSFPCPQPRWRNSDMSNPTETEILAMEFDAVLSVQLRVGFSTLYRLARRESGATIAGPCQSENALEGACRLLNIVLHQKKNAHRLV